MSNSGIYIDSEKAEAIDEEYLKKCKEINELKKEKYSNGSSNRRT